MTCQSIALALDGAEYEPEQFPGLIYRLKDPKTATLLFRSGKVVCTGGQVRCLTSEIAINEGGQADREGGHQDQGQTEDRGAEHSRLVRPWPGDQPQRHRHISWVWKGWSTNRSSSPGSSIVSIRRRSSCFCSALGSSSALAPRSRLMLRKPLIRSPRS
ncbi:MAG: hypothetical protein MZV70_43815 [Desulfobacterales bacterium]|nr:hypothetical protein [Desulfobacterales bacterium]